MAALINFSIATSPDTLRYRDPRCLTGIGNDGGKLEPDGNYIRLSGLNKNFTSDTLDNMEQPPKKILHFKAAFIIIFAVFFPQLPGLFIPLNPILSVAVSVTCVILSVIFLFWLLKPLDLLIRGTRVFSDGQLNHRVNIKSGDEFEDVGNSFNLMADKLSKTLQNLESQQLAAIGEKDKLNQILSAVVDGIIALDFNKNVIFFNKSAEELTGYSQAEVYGRPIDHFIHVFTNTDEVLPKTYCQDSFNQSANLIGKADKQTKVNLITAQINNTTNTHLNCILQLHDLSKEEELEQMKLDFVSMASHELKTPLTSIIGYLSVFLNENRNKLAKENLLFLDKAFISAQQLQTLIANLLNVNKIEREQLTVAPEPVDYFPIITKVAEELKSQAIAKNIVLSILPPAENVPKVLADPVRLAEVVANLLSNALNYTNPGGKVTISTTVSATEITTAISDTGIGIPKEAIPHLFSRFFRVSNRLQKASKGTGLGLYIARSIIEKLHGKIWVESEVGKGSKFSFTVPIVQNSGIVNTDQFTKFAIESGALNY